MTDGVPDGHATFIEMAREFPIRTGIYTFGLPVFTLLQLINGVVHDGPLVHISLFGVLIVAFSVMLTQYHIAIYRRKKVTKW